MGKATDTHETIVGNVGQVHQGYSLKDAQENFDTYVKLSKEGHGRFAGEPVTWMVNGEIYKEYNPEAIEAPSMPASMRRGIIRFHEQMLNGLRDLIDDGTIDHTTTVAQLLDIVQKRSSGDIDYKLPLVATKDGKNYWPTTPDIDAIREASLQGEIDLPMWFGDRIAMLDDLAELGFTTNPLYSQLTVAIDQLIPKK